MSKPSTLTITPDLQTRESVMIAAGRAQFAVTDRQLGGCLYIKVECKQKNEGAGKRYLATPLDIATHVFISEKGYGTPRLGTYYPPRPGYDNGRFFSDGGSFAHEEALAIVVAHVNGQPYDTDRYDVQVESRCGLCGRELTDPESIKRGIGPECAQKPTGTIILKASAFAQLAMDTDAPKPGEHGGDTYDEDRQAAYERGETVQITRVERIEVPPVQFTPAELESIVYALRYTDRELGDHDMPSEYRDIADKIDAYRAVTEGVTA
jgi:hypothetical protein